MYTLRDNWNCLLYFGFSQDPPDLNLEQDVLQLKDISMFKSKLNNVFDIVIPVYHKERPLAYVLIGDVDEQKHELSPGIKHLPFVQTLANIIIVAIENKRLFKENLEKIAITKELELASQMQSMLFPEQLPNNDQFHFHAFYLPIQEVGGDYYDFIQLNKEEFLFCIADVSGKGLSAALLMSNFQANLRALCNYIPDLKDLAIELNKKVMSNAKGEKFITFFCAKFNSKTRQLHYLNLGHHPALLFQQNQFFQLDKGSIGLGMFDELPELELGEKILKPDDIIVLYTDGLIENINRHNEFFSVQDLMKIISENHFVQLPELTGKIMDKLMEHKENQLFTDDITVFSGRFLLT